MNDITTATAIWGAITGTAGVFIALFSLYISYLIYKRDRADIKLEFEKDRQLIGAVLHGYKRNTDYVCLSVLNKGRRPVTISKAYAGLLRETGGFIFPDSMIRGSHELTEGKRIDFLSEQEGIDFSDISYFEATDSVGNKYRLNHASWLRRFFWWFLDVIYLRKKPKITEVNKGKL